jgi:hypothetical protein
MAKSQQTHAKRARELALKERRERKQAKKADAAAQRAAGGAPAGDHDGQAAEGHTEPEAAVWDPVDAGRPSEGGGFLAGRRGSVPTPGY